MMTSDAAPSVWVPLDPVNQAAFPTSDGGDPYPETIALVDGHDKTDDVDWADGQGYVKAPILAVWMAMQDPAVISDRRELNSWDVYAANSDPTSDFSFHLNLVTNSSPSVNYIVDWKEQATAGTKAAPTTVVVLDVLVQSATFAGVQLMTILSDSIILTAVDDNTTSFSAIRHRNSLESSPAAVQQYLSDLYASVVASVHGQPLPTYTM